MTKKRSRGRRVLRWTLGIIGGLVVAAVVGILVYSQVGVMAAEPELAFAAVSPRSGSSSFPAPKSIRGRTRPSCRGSSPMTTSPSSSRSRG
ncbi:MAG: hypothetical protein U0Q04_03235 [Microbacterium sp.]